MDGYPGQDGGGYNVPPTMNPPPQIFGDYGSDSPVQYAGSYFADNDGQGGLDDSNDTKRRRIARACDMCRKKKIKCDGKMPSCSHCINYKTECIFTQVEKKRNPPKGAKYIEGLENRLSRFETLLKLSGLLGGEGDETDLGTLEKRLSDKAANGSNGGAYTAASSRSPEHSEDMSPNDGPDNSQDSAQEDRRESEKSAGRSPEPRPKLKEETAPLNELMDSLVTTHLGEARFVGSSSGFSIFSPKGIQWVNEKTGDDSFQKMITQSKFDEDLGRPNMDWKPEIFGDIFSRRVFRPLPPLNEALSLLKDYFDNFNCTFPLFHEPTFMHLVHRQYSRNPYEGSGWWASLNCALAIAHRLRVMSNLVPREEDQKAWGYLKNALGVMAELTMKNTDLLSVQALLGMGLFLLGTQNPQPSFLLVAAATRLAHSIGLHKRGSAFNLTPVEIEQRKRVFWIAYLLDKDMCLRSGRPPAQDDDDMNVELPSDDPGDNIGNIPLADGKGTVNLFRLMCTFAVICGKVYKKLYSTKAAKSSDGELLNIIGELDKELEEWRDEIPIDFRPEHDIKTTHTPLILHVVVLHFAYYNCLTTIQRMSVSHGYWTSRLANYAIQGLNARPLNPRVLSSATICVNAARASIQLLRYIPQGDYACVWMVIYYPVCALMTLFTHVLQNPQDARARSDLRLMHSVVSFLSAIAVDEESGGIRRMLEVCTEFERIGKIVVERSDKEVHSRRKRKAPRDHEEAQPPAPASTTTTEKTTPNPQTPKLPTSTVQKPLGTPEVLPKKAHQQLQPQQNQQSQSRHTSAEILSQTFSPPINGLSSPDSAGDGSVLLPGYGAEPGNFPQMFTDISDLSQFGPGGIASPDMSNFNQQIAAQELWQMPMGLEWEWPGVPPEQYGMGMDGIQSQPQQPQQQQQQQHARGL